MISIVNYSQPVGQSLVAPAPGYFSNAHDFVINNPTMVSYVINTGRAGTNILTPAVDLDSSCH